MTIALILSAIGMLGGIAALGRICYLWGFYEGSTREIRNRIDSVEQMTRALNQRWN